MSEPLAPETIAGRRDVIRVDRYSPSWVLGIIEHLDDGYTGAEAVAQAVRGLNHEADETARKAAEREARAAKLEPLAGAWLCAADMVREHREHAAEHRRYECYLRDLAGEVAKLRGEYIPIARLLR